MSSENVRQFITQLVELAVLTGALTGFGFLLWIAYQGLLLTLNP